MIENIDNTTTTSRYSLRKMSLQSLTE